MKSTLLFFIFNLICVIQVVSQINLIPNYSFENGSGTPGIERYDHPEQPGPCYCRYIPTPYWETKTAAAKEFDEDIDNWKNARYNNSYLHPPTPDWLDIDLCPWDFKTIGDPSNFFLPYSGKRCLYLLDGGGDHKEGVRNSIPVLATGIKYQFRIKILFEIQSNDWSEFSIYLTEKHEQWKTCPKKIEILRSKRTSDHIAGEWYDISTVFTLPSDKNNISNIVILVHKGKIVFDHVELYSFCPPVHLIENKTYVIKESAYEAGVIRAGYDVGAPTPNGHVIVKNGADIIYKAEIEVSLEPCFETEPGAEFLAFIAPCGRDCDYLPSLNFNDNFEICSQQKIQIGMPSLPANVNFVWTAEPASAMQYLINANSTNPVFDTPPNSCGHVIYTLKVWNECDEVVMKSVRIKYNTSNQQSSLQIQNIVQNNFHISFNAITGNCTDKIIVQVYSSQNNYSNAVFSKTYRNNIVFFNSNLHWTSAGNQFSPCYNYKIKISSFDICTQNEIIEEIIWTRNPNIQLLHLPNVITANNDGINDCLEFSVSGAENYHVIVYKIWGNNLYDQSGIITNNLFCTWVPQANLPSGTYFWIARFWNSCGHEVNTQGTVFLFNSNSKSISPVNEKTNNFCINEFINLYPNPARNEISVSFNFDGAAQIVFLDVTGREVLRLIRNDESVLVLSLENITSGVYFVFVNSEIGQFIQKIIKYE